MSGLFEPERIKKMIDVINSSITQIQLDNRRAIFDRFKRYLKNSNDDEEFYALAWNDFPVWVVSFIDDDSGKPLFPAKWQCEYADLMTKKKYVWALCCRKTGKSTLLALKNLHDLCGKEKKRVVCFAPTMKQDFVFDKMNKYLCSSPYLFETFVSKGWGASVTKDYMELLNGSTCVNKTIGLTTKGELVRGEYGDIVSIDEVQKIEEPVMRQIIQPIIADAYSPKKLRQIGTPNLNSNPNLERNWRLWLERSKQPNSEYAVLRIDWKRGIAEGAIDEKYVLSEKEWMTPDEFAMEYEARFPELGSRFFSIEILEECCLGTETEKFHTQRNPLFTYIMSVDFATYANRTQILIGAVDKEKKILKYANWKEIDPKVERMDYENQIIIIKDMFHTFGCEWICPDATSNQDALIRMLVTGDNAIPEGSIYKTSDRLGFCASDILNDQMWRNHRQQIIKHRIKVPRGGAIEERFKNKWIQEHNELDVTMIRNGNLVKLTEPKNGYKDLAVASAMMSLYLMDIDKSKPWFGIGVWDETGRKKINKGIYVSR